MNFKNSIGWWKTIYDTDHDRILDQWHDYYNKWADARRMMTAIENVRGTNKRRCDEFIEILYEPWKKTKYEN